MPPREKGSVTMSKKKGDIPEQELVEESVEVEQAEETEETLADEAVSEQDAVEEIKKLADENHDKYLRLAAEFDNYKKRTQKEKDELSLYVAGDTIAKILPVMDNLERALASCEADKGTPMYDGVSMVLKQCAEIFEAMGVTPIPAVGEPFDPNLHNAVMHVEDDSVGENTVVEELMRGYQYKGKVIRYSMVKVAN